MVSKLSQAMLPTLGSFTGDIIPDNSNIPDALQTVETAFGTKENLIAPGTTAQVLRGDKTWIDLTKNLVGLGNVDNTSDLDKPVSNAVQNALDLKQSSDPKLTVITNLTPAANKLMYWTGANSAALIDLTAAGRALLDDSDASAQRVTLGLGTAAVTDTGTSGTKVPLLSGANTWSDVQTFTTNMFLTPASGNALLYISSLANNFAFVGFRSAGIDRWRIGKYNDTETGSNVGGDFYIDRRGDDGSSLGHALRITRANGDITFGGKLLPSADNSLSIGDSTKKLSNIYTVALTASNVSITGGTISGITDLSLADGGTGASTASQARINLGLGNVDNTSDLNKPISNAVQAALDKLTSNYISYKVTATSQTVFNTNVTLTAAPIVYRNGRLLAFTDYTWSGTNVTLSSPAYTDDDIIIEVGGSLVTPTVNLANVIGLGNASSSVAGLMSTTDKVRLDAYPTPLTSHNALLAQPLNLLDYCTNETQRDAVLGGTVGIEIPLNLAISAAAIAGRAVFIPGRGTYKTSTNGVIANPTGVSIYGEGCTIQKVGTGPLFRTGPTSDPAMGGARLVDGTWAAGTETVSVLPGTASQFTAGQWVIITDRTRIYSLANNAGGEMQLIKKVDTVNDKITFWSPTKYSYLAGAVGNGYARIVAAPLIKNTVYSNFNVRGDDSVDLSTTNDVKLFQNRWLLNPRFENLRLERFLSVGIDFVACVGWVVHNAHFLVGGSATTGTGTPDSTEGLPGFSYGVCEAGPCVGGIMSNCVGINIRHVYSTSSLTPSGGVPADYGEPTGTLVTNNIALYPVNAGFDTHESGWGISFINNKVIGGHFVGMQIRCNGCIVDGLEVINTIGAALWLRGGATTNGDNAYAKDTMWDNVVARKTNLGVSFDNIDWRERGAICDEASGTRGGTLHTFDTGGSSIMMYRNGGNTGGYVERVIAVNPCQLASTNKFVVDIRNFFGEISVNNIHAIGATKVTNLLRGQGANGKVRSNSIYGVGHTGADYSFTGGMAFVNNHVERITNIAVRSFATRAALLASTDVFTNGTIANAGGYQYLRNSASTLISDLPGWDAINPSFVHFGGVTDGSADVAGKVEACLTAYKECFIPAGTHLITTINATGIIHGIKGRSKFKATGTDIPIKFWGSTGAYNDFNGVYTAGEKNITIYGSVTDLAAGDWVITECDNPPITNMDGQGTSEFIQFDTIDTTAKTATLMQPLDFDYPTSKSRGIRRVNFLKNVGIRNIEIEGNMTLPNLGSSPEVPLIDFRWCRNAFVTDCEIHKSHWTAIMFMGCLSHDASRNYIHDLSSSDDDYNGGMGYCVQERAVNLGGTIQNNRFENARTGYTTGAGKFEIYRYGVPVATQVLGNNIKSMRSGGISTHEAGMFQHFIGNTIKGCRSTGISARAVGHVIQGNLLVDIMGSAIRIQSSATGYVKDTVITGNVIYKSNLGVDPIGSSNVDLGAINSVAPNAIISGNVIMFCGGPAIRLNYIQNGMVSGNMIYNPCQLTTTQKYAIGASETGSNNYAIVTGNGLISTDGKVTNFIFKPSGYYFEGQNYARGLTGPMVGGSTTTDQALSGVGANKISYGYRAGPTRIVGVELSLLAVRSGTITVQAPTGTTTGTLTRISGAEEGTQILLRCVSGETITITNTASASDTNSIYTRDGQNIVLNDPKKIVVLILLDGKWTQPQ